MSEARTRLEAVLRPSGPIAVAVSGGVDSLTLATLAHRLLGAEAALMVHATSPAVPREATDRVRAEASRQGWSLDVIDAGEFADPAYRANPVDRCFFCKTNLYGAIRRVTDRRIASGANLDDLGEYRPGLDAAARHDVRHPFVEAGLDKRSVRGLARVLGLGDIAELPAAPCLASRIETGIRIEPAVLGFIHAAERLVSDALGRGAGPSRKVRCRVRAAGIVIELDADSLAALDARRRSELDATILAQAPAGLGGHAVSFAPYRTGSAFLTDRIGADG